MTRHVIEFYTNEHFYASLSDKHDTHNKDPILIVDVRRAVRMREDEGQPLRFRHSGRRNSELAQIVADGPVPNECIVGVMLKAESGEYYEPLKAL